MAEYKAEKKVTAKKEKSLKQIFTAKHAKKSELISRTEDYASHTLPYLFPRDGHKDSEMQQEVDSLGARAVNYLSNKVTMTMFAPHQPFFRLTVAMAVLGELQKAAAQGDEDAKAILDGLDQVLVDKEKSAMEELNYNRYRAEATMASKLLIVTGNAVLYHPMSDMGKVQCYNLRDYIVCRDLSGTMIELITRDKKALSTFSDKVIAALRASDAGKYKDDDYECTLYTQVKLQEDGKYHLRQDIEDVQLETENSAWVPEELPWIVLTWNLVRGEDYGRGLVEDYAGSFHALNVLTNSIVDVAGLAADVKFLVKPTSVLDVKALNDSESGTYHSGEEGDVTTVQINKMNDLQIVEAAIERIEKQISAGFSMTSGTVRDAERVTREEIKTNAMDLELSYGGIYSRFAQDWQYRTAVLLLKRVDVKVNGKALTPQIITGLDSLSRAGDLDNFRLMCQDMSMMATLPEPIQQAVNPLKLAAYLGTRRGVDYMKFMKTQDEIQQEQQAKMQQMNEMNQQQIANEASGAVATEAGKAAFKEE